MSDDNANQIAALNDRFRSTFQGGRVLLTAGIDGLCDGQKVEILERVRTFAAFDADNDPYGEHDFGSIEIDGQRIFWKIDYYDPTYSAGSEDSANTKATGRVLTIMLADEY